MAKIQDYDPVVQETLSRLDGLRLYLDEMQQALERARDHALRELDASDIHHGEELGELHRAAQFTYEEWLPEVLAHSVITTIHTAVGTSLDALCEHLREQRKSKLRAKDLRGRGIERSTLFLTRVIGIPCGSLPGWSALKDMSELRHAIVHRGGVLPQDRPHMTQILSRYDGLDAEYGELRIPISTCRTFIEHAEHFFEGLFEAAGLPLKPTAEP